MQIGRTGPSLHVIVFGVGRWPEHRPRGGARRVDAVPSPLPDCYRYQKAALLSIRLEPCPCAGWALPILAAEGA